MVIINIIMNIRFVLVLLYEIQIIYTAFPINLTCFINKKC